MASVNAAEGVRAAAPGRVAAVLVTGAITFHWIPAFWSHTLQPVAAFLGPNWADYSTLLLLGFVLTIWSPGAFGLRLGNTLRRRRFVLTMAAILLVPMIVGMLFMRTPFFGGTRAAYVCVPLAEELLFRGFVFAVLAQAFPRSWSVGSVRVSVAVVVSAIAFGLWHLGGLRLPANSFICLQLLYTTLGGLGFGLLRENTGSLWACWTVHFLVNLWAVEVPGPFW